MLNMCVTDHKEYFIKITFLGNRNNLNTHHNNTHVRLSRLMHTELGMHIAGFSHIATYLNNVFQLKTSYTEVLHKVESNFRSYQQGSREGGGVPGVTTPGPGPKRGPDTNCYKSTSTARYEVKLIAD